MKKVSSEVIDQKESKHSIKDFQGVWESFSEYLEHESAFKDYTQNKYYKIVNGKKTLDITLIDQEEKNVKLTIGYLGFLDSNKADFSSEKEGTLVKKIKESGNLLIRFEKGLKNYNARDVEISSNFARYYDVTEILDDDFSYGKKPEKISFRMVSSLPINIFRILKTKSNEDQVNYLADFNIKERSKKIKVITDKTFFYDEMSDESKRKAFLVKGDIAYLEDLHDDWVKVYFDGKTVSGGYIKRSNIEVLE